MEKTNFVAKRDQYAKQDGKIRKGIGISIFHRGCGLGGESPDANAAFVAVHDDGTVMANVGLAENGQGLHTAYTQILAEALNVDPSLIFINKVDTNTVVDSGITAASRGTVMGAQSLKKAGEEMQAILKDTAAMMFHCEPSMVVLEDGFFKIAGVPDAMIPWKDVCNCHHWTGGQGLSLIHIYNATAGLLPIFQVLDFALGNAARALGMEGQIGSLTVGKKADILIINPDSPTPVAPCSVLSYFDMTFQGRQVETVIVDGRIVVKDGHSTLVDEEQVMKD